jgi:hypothetical protein
MHSTRASSSATLASLRLTSLWLTAIAPTFDPKEFQFATFAAMLKSLEGRLIETRKGEFDQQVRVVTSGVAEVAKLPECGEATVRAFPGFGRGGPENCRSRSAIAITAMKDLSSTEHRVAA